MIVSVGPDACNALIHKSHQSNCGLSSEFHEDRFFEGFALPDVVDGPIKVKPLGIKSLKRVRF